jgi:hypothetical protein
MVKSLKESMEHCGGWFSRVPTGGSSAIPLTSHASVGAGPPCSASHRPTRSGMYGDFGANVPDFPPHCKITGLRTM